jgi:hypothetical protein
MIQNRIICLGILFASVISIHLAQAQGGPASGLYQITSGRYSECCGFSGMPVGYALPDSRQSFVRLAVDEQTSLATMTFLADDAQTVFKTLSCPSQGEITFGFGYGFVSSNVIVFLADPGPPPYSTYWHYTVSNSVDSLRLDGTLGILRPLCADAPTQFSHSNVVAVLVPGPKLQITEFSSQGVLLFIQGNAGWTDVIEASEDLVTWSPISTNVMPYSLCPICPYVEYRDAASTNMPRRFYRCFEIP